MICVSVGGFVYWQKNQDKAVGKQSQGVIKAVDVQTKVEETESVFEATADGQNALWKPYTDIDGFYSMSLPADWETTNMYETTMFGDRQTIDKINKSNSDEQLFDLEIPLQIWVLNESNYTPPDKTSLNGIGTIDESVSDLDGVVGKAYKFTYTTTMPPVTSGDSFVTREFYKNGHVYLVSTYDPQKEKTVDKILDTFKFLQ